MTDVKNGSTARKVHIYCNGDKFFTGRRFVINPKHIRTYDSLLTAVTNSLGRAVRVLRTPENGHAVSGLDDLETGRSYVACSQHKFVKLGYEDITIKPKQASRSPERRNKISVSGKIRKIDRTPIAIFVYTNGEVLEQPRRILLKPWVQKTWETVLVAINEKINLRTGAVRHIIDYQTKLEITEGVHFKNNEYYIAVGSEKFKDIDYGVTPVILSPKQQQKRRYPTLQPLKGKKKSGASSGEESQGGSPLQSSTQSTQSIEERHDEPSKRSKKKTTQQPANNEEGIPIKPIKHKRGSSDKAKEVPPPAEPVPADEPKKKPVKKQPPPPAPAPKEQPKNQPPAKSQPPQKNQPTNKKPKATVDLDKDEGGVFKSKGKKQKASEVSEDKRVKEEVPIDKRKAEEVEG